MALSLYDKVVLLDGAMAYWPLDGTQGDFAFVDASGNNHGARPISGLLPWYGPGAPPGIILQSTGPVAGQGSVLLDGQSWLEVMNVEPLPYKAGPRGPFSFEAWFNAEDPLGGSSHWGTWPPGLLFEIIDIWTATFNNSIFEFDVLLYGGLYDYTSIFPPQNGYQGGIFLNDAFSDAEGFWDVRQPVSSGAGAPVEYGLWHHVVATYDGAHVSLYHNGAALTTRENGWDEGSPYLFQVDIGQQPFNCRLGAGYGGGWQYPFQGVGAAQFDAIGPSTPNPAPLGGALACVAMYPTCLSATQVAEHYALATTGLHVAGYTIPDPARALGYAGSTSSSSTSVAWPGTGALPASPELRATHDPDTVTDGAALWEHDGVFFRAQTRDGFTVLER